MVFCIVIYFDGCRFLEVIVIISEFSSKNFFLSFFIKDLIVRRLKFFVLVF